VTAPEILGRETATAVVANAFVISELIAQVGARVPVDQRELESIERILLELDRLEDPCSEHADPVHLTASGIVVSERGVLLLKHRRLGIWVQPGGHIDAGETPWDAARREVQEETGLRVVFSGVPRGQAIYQVDHVDVHPGPRGHTHLDLRYLMQAGADGSSIDPCPPPEESQEVEWLGWDAAIERADLGLRGALIALRP
jgi:8-oxo-dGTP pyrophosphatase MutT (NUDIX family)